MTWRFNDYLFITSQLSRLSYLFNDKDLARNTQSFDNGEKLEVRVYDRLNDRAAQF